MKKLIPLFLMLCCLVSVTACSKDEIVSNYNQALQSIGDKGLTDDKDLQGKREFGIDSYVGSYTADYDNFSGNYIEQKDYKAHSHFRFFQDDSLHSLKSYYLL